MGGGEHGPLLRCVQAQDHRPHHCAFSAVFVTKHLSIRVALYGWFSLLLVSGCATPQEEVPQETDVAYTYEASNAAGGSGKFYLGREIPAVTDHEPGAAWLERPEREASEFPNRVAQALDLRPTDVVADIGAGTGYFTFRLSPLVPEGLVLAVDIQQEMLDRIAARREREGVPNVRTILGTVEDPNLPDRAVDVVLIALAYHEFSHPKEMLEHVVEALRPGGRVVLVEYRGEDATISVDPLHKMTEAQIRREMEAVGLVWMQTKDVLPQQHFVVFQKPLG